MGSIQVAGPLFIVYTNSLNAAFANKHLLRLNLFNGFCQTAAGHLTTALMARG